LGKWALPKKENLIMNQIQKYGNDSQIAGFKPIYYSWQEGRNYNEPNNPNHLIEIINLLGSRMETGSRELQTELEKKGLTLKRGEIERYIGELKSMHLVTSYERTRGITYKLEDNYGKKFYVWLNENAGQSVRTADLLNGNQSIFEEILGLWGENKQLPKDQNYCGNPFVVVLKTIGSKNRMYVRRDHILYGLRDKGIDVNYDSLGEILNILTGKKLIREGVTLNKKHVKEYAFNEEGMKLFSYLGKNCKDR